MKLSELITAAEASLAAHGDIDVFVPCADEGINDDLTEASEYKVRQRGSPYVPREKWHIADTYMVFVIA